MRAVLIAVLLFAGCGKTSEGKEGTKAAEPTKPAATAVGADGVREVKIEAGMEGYVPDTIPGKPGEKLNLVFTRTVEGECLRELKTPDGKVVELPMKKPVEIAITVPASGELKFACGMDMFQGRIVAGG